MDENRYKLLITLIMSGWGLLSLGSAIAVLFFDGDISSIIVYFSIIVSGIFMGKTSQLLQKEVGIDG